MSRDYISQVLRVEIMQRQVRKVSKTVQNVLMSNYIELFTVCL